MTGHQRNLFFLLAIALLHLVCAPVALSAEIRNVTITQLGNRVLLEFDVDGNEPEADVRIVLTIEGRKYSSDSLHLEGDLGKTKTGKGKRIYWNVLMDFPKGLLATVDWDLAAGFDISGVWKYKEREFKLTQTGNEIGGFVYYNDWIEGNIHGNIIGDKVVMEVVMGIDAMKNHLRRNGQSIYDGEYNKLNGLRQEWVLYFDRKRKNSLVGRHNRALWWVQNNRVTDYVNGSENNVNNGFHNLKHTKELPFYFDVELIRKQ